MKVTCLQENLAHGLSVTGRGVSTRGSLPILGAWCLTRVLGQFGRLLAVVVGTSLVVPLVLWHDGFVRWCGRLFGSIFVGLLGSMLLSSGFAAAGLGIMIAWLVVPGVQAIVAWESRRAEIAADRVAVAAGFGQQLLEALELLALAEPRPAPGGLLSLLCRPGASLVDRAERIRRALADPEVTD